MTNAILIATAGAAADKTAEYVVGIAASLKAKLIALHVVGIGDDDESVDVLARFESHAARNEVEIHTEKRVGDVVNSIISCAKDHDAALIVLGASKGKVLSQWIGANVFDNSTVPVVVIPHHWIDDDSAVN